MILNISKNGKYWFGLSGLLIVASFVVVGIWGLRPGIDFVGGSIIEVHGDKATVPTVRKSLEGLGYRDTEVQATGKENVQVRLQQLNTDEHKKNY